MTISLAIRRALPAAALVLALGAGCGPDVDDREPEPGAGSAEAALPLLGKLGPHHRAITTTSEQAGRYFDQGLALTFGFNHDAAVRSFEEAVRLDPACAICFWGIGYALGPNINAPMGPEAGRRAYQATQRALALAGGASPVERALIGALAKRYAPEPPDERGSLDAAYAEAMRGVAARHPDDVDVAVLTAEALMDLMPWNYWTADGKPHEHTQEVLHLLELAMEREPEHVGANHYYIHAVEEHYPERGEAAADRLNGLAPSAGHLVHMPSHIYWRIGRYEDAAEVNKRAAASDETFFATCSAGGFYRAAYYPHNLHFLWSAAMAEGQGELALMTARKLAAKSEPLYEEFDFVEEFMVTPVATLLRFGRFDAVLGEPEPPEGRAYQRGFWHYARGIAFTRLQRPEEAAAELEALRGAVQSPACEKLVLAGGVSSCAKMLAVGADHLAGELAAARGDGAAAVAALESAVTHQDAIAYMEPPPWYFPTRQALGAVLLDAGRAADAEAVYRTSLKHYPKNGWTLFGLAQSLDAQGRDQEAGWVREGFTHAFARADVTLRASRF